MTAESPFASSAGETSLPETSPEGQAAPACCPGVRMVKILAALVVIGGAATYGAAAARPEFARQLQFLPGMTHFAKSGDSSGGCGASCSTGGCSSLSRVNLMTAKCETPSACCVKSGETKSDETGSEVVLAADLFADESTTP